MKILDGMKFDAVVDVNAYNGEHVRNLLESGVDFKKYILISSSAVYPEWEAQPFSENCVTGENRFWVKDGTDKIDAEDVLLNSVRESYVIRPPYLYGVGNNVYREAFVFDCALQDRIFYVKRVAE